MMRFQEIGQQLRAYRLESGLRAEEIAARLGVSRAALYRYEKGEVIKLDTINRLAELLNISPLSLLGIGVEYYNRPVGFFERLRQSEEMADQILIVDGAYNYLVTSDQFDQVLADAFEEAAEAAASAGVGDRASQRTMAEQVLGIQSTRKRTFGARRPSIITLLSPVAVRRFLDVGIGGTIATSDRTRRAGRDVAAREIENIAALMDAEPMGLQFGLLAGQEPNSAFSVLRSRERATLAVNPFRPDSLPSAPTGVAMITGADEAISAHQRVAEASWREATKGSAGAAKLREMIATATNN